jgi:hypothetical protein
MAFTTMAIQNIVAYFFKAGTMEPDKQPLLGKGSETTIVSRQWLGIHIPATMDTHPTIKVVLVTVFSIRCVQRGCKEDNWGTRVSSV